MPFLHLRKHFPEHPLFHIRKNNHARAWEIGVNGLDRAKLRDRAVILSCVEQENAVVGGNYQREGIQLARAIALRKRLVEAFDRLPANALRLLRLKVFRFIETLKACHTPGR